MLKLEAYNLVNKCETLEELADAITAIGKDNSGFIKGRRKYFRTSKLAAYCTKYKEQLRRTPELLTREYGIRQQALYILHYEEK